MHARSLAPFSVEVARLTRGLDLFRRSQVRLRKLYVLFCAGNLTFMSFR